MMPRHGDLGQVVMNEYSALLSPSGSPRRYSPFKENEYFV